tara:strand:- start:81 stop:578 length:498 start_codon:yes stop_codon:yes gene_type:complete
MKDSWVIFDLDGTLALIDERRKISTKDNGKIDWDTFFNPKNIDLDTPNHPVIKMAQVLHNTGHKIAILSGRSKITKKVTMDWLKKYDVPYNILKMRPHDTAGSVQPTHKTFRFMPDDDLKQYWLDDLFPGEIRDRIVAVFDDRQKVVDMWRKNGLTCMQVAPGNF